MKIIFHQKYPKYILGARKLSGFMQCEACQLAKLRGEWIEEPTTALKQSSYVDAWASQELEQFKEDNPDMFLKSGELKADYRICDSIIEQIKADSMFLKYITAGETQKIMTGTIANVPVKIKIDCFHSNKLLTDLKVIKDMKLLYNEKTHQKENFIDYYDYVLQRKFVSRDCEAKYRQKTTIYNCSCN